MVNLFLGVISLLIILFCIICNYKIIKELKYDCERYRTLIETNDETIRMLENEIKYMKGLNNNER